MLGKLSHGSHGCGVCRDAVRYLNHSQSMANLRPLDPRTHVDQYVRCMELGERVKDLHANKALISPLLVDGGWGVG